MKCGINYTSISGKHQEGGLTYLSGVEWEWVDISNSLKLISVSFTLPGYRIIILNGSPPIDSQMKVVERLYKISETNI